MNLYITLFLTIGVALHENQALKCPETISDQSCEALKKASAALLDVAEKVEKVKTNSLVDISNEVNKIWSAIKVAKDNTITIDDKVIKIDASLDVKQVVGDIWMLLSGLEYIKRYTGGVIPKNTIKQAAQRMADAFGKYKGEDVRSFQKSLMKVGGPYMPVIRKFISEANFVNRRKAIINKLVSSIGNAMNKIGLNQKWSKIKSSLEVHIKAIVKIGAAMEHAVFSMDSFFKANHAEQDHSNDFWESLL